MVQVTLGINMIRWTPTRPTPQPQRWQSRQEILKAHLNSLSPEELRSVRPDYYWLHFGQRAWLNDIARKAHFNPAQPRVPAGSPDGGQWTGDGGSAVQPVFYDPRRFAIQKAIEAGLALYTWLSTRSGADKQAIITFDAKEFRPDGRGELGLNDVKLLDRDKVDAACPRLGEVQERTDNATEAVRRSRGDLPPAEFGTAVHTNLKIQINNLRDPNFRAEVSYVKSQEENYGKKESIRIDVLEKVGDGTVCVYDIKTGQRGLSIARANEIAKNVFGAYPGTQRIIVSEIRPKR